MDRSCRIPFVDAWWTVGAGPVGARAGHNPGTVAPLRAGDDSPDLSPDRPERYSRGVDESSLLARLRDGEESAFAEIVTAWSPVMLHVARGFVSTRASAQEVVQEAWLAVVRGLDGFQGRSALRTWVLAITANLARRRGATDARTVPWTDMAPDGAGTVDPARFRGSDDRWPGGWTPAGAPQPWGPEAAALSGEARALLAAELDALPRSQGTVVAMRDVDGLTAQEVCDALGISAANQRVLLHRGRARLRQHLEDYYHVREVTPDGAVLPADRRARN